MTESDNEDQTPPWLQTPIQDFRLHCPAKIGTDFHPRLRCANMEPDKRDTEPAMAANTVRLPRQDTERTFTHYPQNHRHIHGCKFTNLTRQDANHSAWDQERSEMTTSVTISADFQNGGPHGQTEWSSGTNSVIYPKINCKFNRKSKWGRRQGYISRLAQMCRYRTGLKEIGTAMAANTIQVWLSKEVGTGDGFAQDMVEHCYLLKKEMEERDRLIAELEKLAVGAGAARYVQILRRRQDKDAVKLGLLKDSLHHARDETYERQLELDVVDYN
uniref:Uncharacterized protein n=1 Tax=Tanacetum cinerariifolium TaxID=118510 RepID=A0A6L2M685_TANCI|nr:hypothetical protein [Tanacetum cinerariifolium]